MAIVFETEKDFEDAVMAVLKDRLSVEVVVEKELHSFDERTRSSGVSVEIDINDRDENGYGLLARGSGVS